MKQTVEEVAREYRDFMVKENGGDQYDFVSGDIKDAFKAGAEWQEKQFAWISVKERLPGHHSSVVYYSKKHGLLAVNAKHITEEDIKTMGITYWCYLPIPSFDQILEVNKDVLQRLKEK